jgi:hypothetical protein
MTMTEQQIVLLRDSIMHNVNISSQAGLAQVRPKARKNITWPENGDR